MIALGGPTLKHFSSSSPTPSSSSLNDSTGRAYTETAVKLRKHPAARVSMIALGGPTLKLLNQSPFQALRSVSMIALGGPTLKLFRNFPLSMTCLVSMIALGGPTLKQYLLVERSVPEIGLNDSTGRAYTETPA